MQGWFNVHRLKDKSHMIIVIDAENAFDKIQCFHHKINRESRTEGNIPQHKKRLYDKSIVNITLNRDKFTAIPLKSGPTQGSSLSLLLFNTVHKTHKLEQ